MFQRWSRLKCIDWVRLGFSIGAAFGTISASASTASVRLPEILQQIEKKYTQSSTLSAEFSQINDNATLSKKKTTSGKIFLKHPSKIRWETEKPDVSLLVSDGKSFWFYTPPFEEGERGQLIEKKSSEVQSKLANSLLAGSFSGSGLKIQQKTPFKYLLTPKPGTAGTVAQATIEIDPAKKLVQKVILDHKGGNHTEISLSKIELGKPLENEIFVFKAPPNTDRIRE